MSEKHVPEILKSLKEQLKEATEKKERLERVISGLEDIYALNAKVARRLDKLNIETETTTATPVPKMKPMILHPREMGSLRPMIEALILKRLKAKEIVKQTGAKISTVYLIKHDLKKAGKLK